MVLLGNLHVPEPPESSSLVNDSLLQQVAKGNQEAFKQLYQQTDRTVYSFILSILKNPHDAEEVMQETYMKVWTSAASYQAQGKPLAWIFTIARNLCYMKFREQKHRADVGFEELEGTETGEVCPQIEQAADKLVLKAALELLKEEERQIVLLKNSSGLKHREIAEALGMPLATVLSKYNRAMKKLEQYLREE